MDVAAGEDREMLKRTLVLYLGLAVLAVRAAQRCLPIRLLVLWYLRRAEAVALERVAELGSWPLYASLAQRCEDSLSEVQRLARLFRTAARAVRKELRWLARWLTSDMSGPGNSTGPNRRHLHPANTAPLLPEPLDSS